jgi:thiol-disulfide isomerase/thioredoxin
MSPQLIQKILFVIFWLILATIIFTPLLCIVLYKRRKVRTCIIFSHIWCMVTFCLLGIFILHTIRHRQERIEYANRSLMLLDISKMMRTGDIEKSISHLDDYLAQTLYRTAYDISDSKMRELNPDILWVWQETKEYFDTYEVKEPYVGSMIPHVRRKLNHVPWSEMQLAIRKFDQTFGNSKIATAPEINMKSWINRPINNEELKNKVILLDFWNIHCIPCIKSLPELQKLHDMYEKRGLLVIACAGGNEQETKKFLDNHKYSFSAGMISWQMCLDYAIRENPTYFLIDLNGNLAWGPENRLPTDNELNDLLNNR